MAAAVDVVDGRGHRRSTDGDDAAAHLRRAVHWQRYGRGPVDALHRAARPTSAAGFAAAAAGGRRDDGDRCERRRRAVDALVAAVDPGLSSPGVESRDVVLVTGPWLAGATSLIAALRDRMPEHAVRRGRRAAPGDAPAAVVFVVSAVAPLTESDCALLDAAANAHRSGHRRGVQDRRAPQLARRAGGRPGCGSRARTGATSDVPWVGVAAAPDLGEPASTNSSTLLGTTCRVDMRTSKPVAGVGSLAADGDRSRYDNAAAGADRQARVTALRESRDDILCASAGCPSPSAPSRCAARFSRRACSCPTSRATGARRCGPNCRRTPPNMTRRRLAGVRGVCDAHGSARWSTRWTTGSPTSRAIRDRTGPARARTAAAHRPARVRAAAAEVAAAGDAADDAARRGLRARCRARA